MTDVTPNHDAAAQYGLFGIAQTLLREIPKVEKALHRKPNRKVLLTRLETLALETLNVAGRFDGAAYIVTYVSQHYPAFTAQDAVNVMNEIKKERAVIERRQIDLVKAFLSDLQREIGDDAFRALWRKRGAPRKGMLGHPAFMTKREQAYHEILTRCLWPLPAMAKRTPLSGLSEILREYQKAGHLKAKEEETDIKNIKRMLKRMVESDDIIPAPDQDTAREDAGVAAPRFIGMKVRDILAAYPRRDKK